MRARFHLALLVALIGIVVALGACGSGGGGLPDGAKLALHRYLDLFGGGASWRIQSIAQATQPQHYIVDDVSVHFDELWCVVIAPPVLMGAYTKQAIDHFFVYRIGSQWSVNATANVYFGEQFGPVGCSNG